MNDPDDSAAELTRHGMVRWYDPRLLLRTGFHAVMAQVIGEITDNREVQAALTPIGKGKLAGFYDYGGEPELVIDYVADLGDGWQATYSVAKAIATPQLAFGGHKLDRARVLVMGGDQVYPGPSELGYLERTVAPYRAACAANEAFEAEFDADVFAVPGNHDWYDGLQAFTRLFCDGGDGQGRDEKRFASWRVRQKRSYFALRLPHDWWLCGVDVQLVGKLNATQLDYLRDIAEKVIEEGDKVILCAAKPSWVLEQTSEPGATGTLTAIAEVFERAGAELKLVLTGDLHHYSHYAPDDTGPHLVTAGGGGAFTHPTHKLPRKVTISWRDDRHESYTRGDPYPGEDVSRMLSYKNLLFPFLNWSFALVIGGIYAVLVWLLETRRLSSGDDMGASLKQAMDGHLSVQETLVRFFETIPKSPEFAIVVLAMVAGLTAFNISTTLLQKIVLGLGHSLAHFVTLVVTYWITIELIAMTQLPVGIPFAGQMIFLGILVVIGGLLGGFVFGIFLLFSLNVMNLQWTNAFSSLRVKDYKHFLRLKIDSQGGLTVYPIGIERTGDDASPPHLIEPGFPVR